MVTVKEVEIALMYLAYADDSSNPEVAALQHKMKTIVKTSPGSTPGKVKYYLPEINVVG